MRLSAFVLTSLLFAPAAAEARVRPRVECSPRSMGDGVLMLINGVWNAQGDDPKQIDNTPPAGFMLKIDSSEEPPPRGPYFKFPDSFPVNGADAFNRIPIPRAHSQLLGDEDFGVQFQLHEIYATDINAEYDCDPKAYNGALADGALSLNVRFSPLADGDELQVRFMFEIFGVDLDFDLVDIDLEDDFTVQVSMVPTVNGDSMDLRFFIDVRELEEAGIWNEVFDDLTLVAAIIAAPACALTPVPWIICEFVAVVAIRSGLEATEPELRRVTVEMMEEALRKATGAYTPNTFLATAETKTREIILEKVRIGGKTLPEAIASLEVPNYTDKIPFNPTVPPVCQ